MSALNSKLTTFLNTFNIYASYLKTAILLFSSLSPFFNSHHLISQSNKTVHLQNHSFHTNWLWRSGSCFGVCQNGSILQSCSLLFPSEYCGLSGRDGKKWPRPVKRPELCGGVVLRFVDLILQSSFFCKLLSG